MDGLRFDRWAHDRLEIHATAGRALLDRAKRTIQGAPVQIELFHPESGQRRALIDAPRADADLAEERAVFSGGVVAADATGRRIETARATYEQKAQHLTAEEPVVLRGRNFEVRGPSLDADLVQQVIAVPGTVEARLTPIR